METEGLNPLSPLCMATVHTRDPSSHDLHGKKGGLSPAVAFQWMNMLPVSYRKQTMNQDNFPIIYNFKYPYPARYGAEPRISSCLCLALQSLTQDCFRRAV
ncbi:UNVERIFIED_CONTAM: hypothetical protein K2H54_045618 [Gekko kuhli]